MNTSQRSMINVLKMAVGCVLALLILVGMKSPTVYAQMRSYTDVELWNTTLNQYNQAKAAEAGKNWGNAYYYWKQTLASVNVYIDRNPARMQTDATHASAARLVQSTASQRVQAMETACMTYGISCPSYGGVNIGVNGGVPCPGGVDSHEAMVGECPGVISDEIWDSILESEAPEIYSELLLFPMEDNCVFRDESIIPPYEIGPGYSSGGLPITGLPGDINVPHFSGALMTPGFLFLITNTVLPCASEGSMFYP